MTSSLFALPEYDSAMARFISTAINELTKCRNPLLGKIETVYVESVPHTRSTMLSGEIVDSAPIAYRLEFSVELKDAIAGNSDSLIVSIDGASEQKERVEMRNLLSYGAQVMDAAGTSLDAKGQPVSRRFLLELMEKGDIDFSNDGSPQIAAEMRHLFHQPSQECTCFTDGRSEDVVMVTSKNISEQLIRLPPPSEDEIAAFEDLIERKRKEHDDRRRFRQLP